MKEANLGMMTATVMLFSGLPPLFAQGGPILNVTRSTFHATIQGAINAAFPGDEIAVWPGTYQESLCFNKNIILRSLNPQDPAIVAATILTRQSSPPTCADRYAIITVSATVTPQARVAGFSITGSLRGIKCNGSNITIDHCDIHDIGVCGSGENVGALIDCDGLISDCSIRDGCADNGAATTNCDGVIRNCVISGNGGQGGAIKFGAALFDSCVIQDNHHQYGVFDAFNGTIDGCVVLNNSGDFGGAVWEGNLVARNSTFAQNFATFFGGAFFRSSGRLENCVIQQNTTRDSDETGGGGLYGWTGELVNCNITQNSSGGKGSGATVELGTRITNSTIDGLSGELGTSDFVTLGAGNFLRVGLKDTLVIGGNCRVSGGGVGRIEVDGLLHLKDSAVIEGVQLTVNRAMFSGNSSVFNSVITAEAGLPFGQFYIEGNASVLNNDIYADGDRYLDVLPELFAQQNNVAANRIYVTITEGLGSPRGGLFELRGLDADCTMASCPSGSWPLAEIPAFSWDTWTLERLELIGQPDEFGGAKINLTNRFDFQAPFGSGESEEVLYVKELVLGENTVLNTGFQRMYYGSVMDADGNELDPSALPNGISIVDIPVQGFSLNIIEMEDDAEFHARVGKRVRDPGDSQTCQCLGTPPCSSNPTTCKEGAITRMLNPISGGGLMEMRTHAPNRQQATSVAAKGSFAKAADQEKVTVAFQYLFTQVAANTELVIYLSDVQEFTSEHSHRAELGRLLPPPTGRPGSVGSNRWATFYGTFPTGTLDFERGTYVELELRGSESSIWIDRWDPAVQCSDIYCSSVVGQDDLDNRDYIVLLANLSKSVDPSNPVGNCGDSATSSDHYIDTGDLSALDTFLNGSNLDDCGPSGFVSALPSAAATLPNLPSSGGILVAGKGDDTTIPYEDALYPLSLSGTCLGQSQSPASSPHPDAGYRSNGRLARDSNGALYQIHAEKGVINLENGRTVVRPKVFLNQILNVGSADVEVGIHTSALTQYRRGTEIVPYTGLPLLDMAFDPQNHLVIYVVPVRVVPHDTAVCPYLSAAKLALSVAPDGSYDYTLARVYGGAPSDQPCSNGCNCSAAHVQDKHHLREIEVDSHGNVFVTSAYALHDDDWVLIFDKGSSSETESAAIRLSQFAVPLHSPTAMTVGRFNANKLYLASSVSRSVFSRVFRYTVLRNAQMGATGLTLDGVVDIDNANALPDEDFDFGHLATIPALQEDPATGSVYVLGYTMPKFEPDDSPLDLGLDPANPVFNPGMPMFTRATFAKIESSATWSNTPASPPAIHSSSINCDGLALPVSAVLFDESCGIESSIPAPCLVDARRTALGGDTPAVTNTFIKSFAITFGDACDVSGAAVGDFTIACTPPGSCPTISNVNTVDQTVTVNLSSAIKVDAWTCITHTTSGDQVCAGHLPADANGNQATLPNDIIALIDHLNLLPGAALPINQCDMDRTGACLPADIITLIDLLIGNGFAVWNGQSLPPLAACLNP